jgi:hypothetical protein
MNEKGTIMIRKAFLPVIALILGITVSIAIASTRVRSSSSVESPFYDSYSPIAEASDYLVVGSYGKLLGRFPVGFAEISEDRQVLANDVYEFTVSEILGQSERVEKLKAGSTVLVGRLVPNKPGSDSGLDKEIASFSSAVDPGVEYALFLAPSAFSPDLNGWVPVGSDFGMLRKSPGGSQGSMESMAPLGPLARSSQSLDALSASTASKFGALAKAPVTSLSPDAQKLINPDGAVRPVEK